MLILLNFSFTKSINAQYNYQQKRDSVFQFVNEILYGHKTLIIKYSSWHMPKNTERFLYDFKNEYQANDFDGSNSEHLKYLIALGIINQEMEELEDCIIEYKEALLICENHLNQRAKTFISIKLAHAYRLNGYYQLALDIYYKYLDQPFVADSTDIPNWGILSNIAESHEIIGENVEAMESCLKLQDLYLEDSMLAEASYNLIQLGRIASHLESDTFYFEYYHRAVEMAYESGRKSRIANNLVNLGKAYLMEGYPDKSLHCFDEAKEFNEFSRPYPQSYYYFNLAQTLFSIQHFDDALANAVISYDMAHVIEANVMEYAACIMISQCYEAMNQNDSAMRYLQLAVKYQSNTYMDKNVSAYRHLSDLSARMAKYKLALSYLDSSFNVYKRVVNDENVRALAKLREKSDYFFHKSRISNLVLDNQKEQEKSRRSILITIGVLAILGFSFMFIYFIRKRHKQLKQTYLDLVQKNIDLDKLNKKLNECELKTVSSGNNEDLKDEDRILRKLKIIMLKDEVFTNSNISLPSLAKMLKTNTSYLSAIINAHYSCNLRSLINGYRISKAKEMLVGEAYTNYSIEGVAMEVGFNSRSSFYQAFKSETGLTPALYLENYRLIEKECKEEAPEK